jgi:uncharacterized integral membrane protein
VRLLLTGGQPVGRLTVVCRLWVWVCRILLLLLLLLLLLQGVWCCTCSCIFVAAAAVVPLQLAGCSFRSRQTLLLAVALL